MLEPQTEITAPDESPLDPNCEGCGAFYDQFACYMCWTSESIITAGLGDKNLRVVS